MYDSVPTAELPITMLLPSGLVRGDDGISICCTASVITNDHAKLGDTQSADDTSDTV